MNEKALLLERLLVVFCFHTGNYKLALTTFNENVTSGGKTNTNVETSKSPNPMLKNYIVINHLQFNFLLNRNSIKIKKY